MSRAGADDDLYFAILEGERLRLGPEVALNSPLPMVHFLFIILSTLRLSASLSLFTGAVAALEYAGLALWYLG